jgi:hypothetical protein
MKILNHSVYILRRHLDMTIVGLQGTQDTQYWPGYDEFFITYELDTDDEGYREGSGTIETGKKQNRYR